MKKILNYAFPLAMFALSIMLIMYPTDLSGTTGAATAGLGSIGLVKAHKSPDILDLQLGGGFDGWDGTENLEMLELSPDADTNFEFAIQRLQRGGATAAEINALRQTQKQAIAGRQLAYQVAATAKRNVNGRPIGTFTVIVKRITANITESLPFVIFGRNSANSFYSDLISGVVLPAGVTLTNVTIGENFAVRGKVIFEFTDSAPTPNVDTVEVTLKSNNMTYTQLLAYLYTDMFEFNQLKLKLSSIAGNALSQQDNPYAIAKTTILGRAGNNEVVPTDWKLAQQNENGILDVDLSAKIDQQTGIVGSIIDIAGFSVTHTFKVSAYIANVARG